MPRRVDEAETTGEDAEIARADDAASLVQIEDAPVTGVGALVALLAGTRGLAV